MSTDPGQTDGDGADGVAMEIIATVSHELRSPLTSIKGYTSLLLSRWDQLDDGQKKMMLEQVQLDADRVTRLITELLDISRLESGRPFLRRQMVDLAQLAGAVVDKVAMAYPDLAVSVSFPPRFPVVYADADKIEQVLTNLVENAAKYARPEGVRITGDRVPVDPGAAVADRVERIVVRVDDAGDGIPPADLDQLFERFYRRDDGRPTGTGLGLWISRGLAEAHGGSLTATSQLGVGSSFRLTLPVGSLDDPGA